MTIIISLFFLVFQKVSALTSSVSFYSNIQKLTHYSELILSRNSKQVVDSIPVTAMMVKIVVSLAENKTLDLPVQPMVYALAFGPTLGGNGSLYGASSNIVCAGVAEKLGHKITFFQYFK